MKTTRETLQGIKTAIEEHGWCRTVLQNEDGACCLLGAWYLSENETNKIPYEVTRDGSYEFADRFPNSEQVTNLLKDCASEYLGEDVAESVEGAHDLWVINDEAYEQGIEKILNCAITKAE